MASQQKTLSMDFSGEAAVRAETPEGRSIPAGTIGIAASTILHALFFVALLILPAAGVHPVKTFHITFVDGGEAAGGNGSPASPPGPMLQASPAPARQHTPPQAAQRRKDIRHPAAPPAIARTFPEKIQAPQPAAETPTAATTDAPSLPPVPQTHAEEAFIAAKTDPVENVGLSTAAIPTGGAAYPEAAGPETAGSGNGVPFGGTAAASGSQTAGSGNGVSSGQGTAAGGSGVIETAFGEANAPRFIHRAMPVYPPLARRRGREGRVVLALLIDKTGKVRKIDVAEGAGFGLTEAAIAAVKRSTFAPARVHGKEVASRAVLPIRFRLE